MESQAVLAQYGNFHFPAHFPVPKIKFPFPAQCPFLDAIFQFSPVLGILFPQFSAFIELTDKAVIYSIFTNALRVDFKKTEHCLLIIYFSNFPFPIPFEFHNFSTERSQITVKIIK